MNEHDLHASFDALARRNADEQGDRIHGGTGLSAGAVVRRATVARRRRAGVTALTGVAAVTGLVLAGSALAHRPDPQPAVTPTPEITRPAPGPTPSPDPEPTDAPETQDAALTSGVVRPYPSAPTLAWSAEADPLWTSRDDLAGPASFGDVSASHPMYPGFRAFAAGGTWLTAVGSGLWSATAGLDASTGEPRGTWGIDACGGVHEGQFVCLGIAGGTGVVQLRDPATGAVVRDVAPGGNGIVVVGDVLLVHGVSGETDVWVDRYDLRTGEQLSHEVLAGAVRVDAAAGGDNVVRWQRSGGVVDVRGGEYEFTVDVPSGTFLGRSLQDVGAVRADGWVLGTTADGTTYAAGPEGQDVALPGIARGTASVWAPAPGVSVPLLSGSDPYDGQPDVVHATDPGTGDELWTFPGADAVVGVAGSTALLAAGDEVVAVDLADGSERWRTAFAEVAAYDGERVILGGNGRALALDLRTGAEVWSLDVGAETTLGVVGDSLAAIGPGSVDATPEARLSALLP